MLPRMNEPPAEFLNHVQAIPGYMAQNLSEADTRVHLIDPVLRILGYTTVGDVRREVPVPATREFIDYELYAAGKAQAIIEAKAVRLPVTDAASAQCVQYASILGVRWCLVTNGVTWAIYNAHAAGPLSEKRVTLVRLDGPEDELAEAWEVLQLFSRESLANANPLNRLLAERVVADELANPDSQAVLALRRAVRSRFNERIAGGAVVEIIDRLMRKGRRGTPVPVAPSTPMAVPAPPPPPPGPPGAAGSTGLSSAAGTQKERGQRRTVRLVLKPDGSMVTIGDLVKAGLLTAGQPLHLKSEKHSGEGIVRADGIEVNGTLYPSASAACNAITKSTMSGWHYWFADGVPLVDLRAEFIRRLGGTVPE
jgi:hypothetical protein